MHLACSPRDRQATAVQVWTNTCCSHQLHAQEPSELDDEASTSEGSVPGAVAAAIRKLEHELGIPPSQLNPHDFRFLTRLHYCAGDVAGGQPTGWGEHEMDYILFIKADVTLAPNADEIQATKYVDAAELRSMMGAGAGNKWSPWFRIIAQSFLYRWWDDLDAVLTGAKHADWKSIHRLSTD